MSEGLRGLRASLQRWRGLPQADRHVALALVALLPAVAVGLRLFGLRRVCRFFSRWQGPKLPLEPLPLDRAAAMGLLVNAVARRLPGHPACLSRSVTLWWLLLRRGTRADVRIGVRNASGTIRAHAWVELSGVVLNDSQDVGQRFAAFEGATLPARWMSS